MTRPDFQDAVLALYKGSFNYLGGEKVEYLNDSLEKPSLEQIQAKLTELQAEYDAKQYQRDRLTEYPSIQELVVALYDEEDKQAIIDKRNAVKAKYPKPE